MSSERMLDGRCAVVTGGGRGIGASVVRALARAGASVVIVARSTDQIESLAQNLREDGLRATAIACDVASEESVASLHDTVGERLPRVDILVNNAGVAHSSPLERIELADWERLMRVNATGTFLCARAFAPSMARNGWGRVINVASVAGLHGARYIAAYAASKHAVIGLTRSLALEFAGRGVTVNAVCPGYVDTGMTDDSVENIMSRTGLAREEAVAAILAHMPQHRLIECDEVAHAVMSLCAEGARGINGQTIVIDGGESAG